MKQNRLLGGTFFAAAIGSFALLGAVVAMNNDNSNDASTTPQLPDSPVTGTPGTYIPGKADGETLHKARLDLAERLGIDPSQIRLVSTSAAGWDGCLGVVDPAASCLQIFLVGTIATFDVGGPASHVMYRYHIGDGRFVATDFLGEGITITDGVPVPAEMTLDANAMLAEYVRQDLAPRLGVDIAEVQVTSNLPVLFSNLCLGFQSSPDQACAEALAEGAIILLDVDGEEYRYHVSHHGIVAVSFEEGETTIDADEAQRDLQQKMLEDLAAQLGVDVDGLSVASFKNVTWPDGCMGVYYKDALCSMALVEGFRAVLVDAEGNGYVYHGGNGEFIAVSFIDPDEIRIGEPVSEAEGEEAPGEGEEPGRIMEPRQAMTEHLAGALGVDPADIVVATFEDVTWPDGCRGVYFKDAFCTLAMTDGWIATLQVTGSEATFLYHGDINSGFTAVWELDESEYTLGEPLEVAAE